MLKVKVTKFFSESKFIHKRNEVKKKNLIKFNDNRAIHMKLALHRAEIDRFVCAF